MVLGGSVGDVLGRYKTASRCSSPLGNLDAGCWSLMAGWAVGSGPLTLPDEAGVYYEYLLIMFTHVGIRIPHWIISNGNQIRRAGDSL